MEDIPGLVVCRVCQRSGPGVDELIALPDELEYEAMKAGWLFFEDGWLCRGCSSTVDG
jgi:rubredoxin